MIDREIKEKLDKEDSLTFIKEIVYKGKNYVKMMKINENDIEYIYYEIENRNIRKVENRELISYFKEKYEINGKGIVY